MVLHHLGTSQNAEGGAGTLLIQAAVPVGGGKASPSGARKTAGAHSNKHSNGGASLPEHPCNPLQLGTLEAEDVEELARAIR